MFKCILFDPYVTVTYNGQTVLIMIEIFICYVPCSIVNVKQLQLNSRLICDYNLASGHIDVYPDIKWFDSVKPHF